jgi:hypothetical protein
MKSMPVLSLRNIPEAGQAILTDAADMSCQIFIIRGGSFMDVNE